MNAPSSHSLSDSASLFEPQNNEDFTNSILLHSRLLKPKAPELTTRSGKQEDLALDAPFAKPRKQRHHLGRNPCNLYTVKFLADLLLTLAPCLFLFHSFLALSVNNDPFIITWPRSGTNCQTCTNPFSDHFRGRGRTVDEDLCFMACGTWG